MKNIFKKLIKLLIIPIITIGIFSFNPNIIKAAVPSEYQSCARIDEYIDDKRTEHISRPNPNSANLLLEAQQWKRDNCTACTPHNSFNDENLNIPLIESGYIMHRFSVDGNLLYCIEPDTIYRSCATYEKRISQVGGEQKLKIAKIMKAATELGANNNTDVYLAAQLYIWDILGLHRNISGIDKNSMKSMIDNKINELEQSFAPTFSQEHYEVEFEQDFIAQGTNDVLTRIGYSLENLTTGFLKSEITSNNVIVNINKIYPVIKKVKLNPHNNISNYESSIYVSTSSQDVMGFDQPLDNLYLDKTISFKHKTGNLTITKKDEYGNTQSGVEYKLYFALDDNTKGEEIRKEDNSSFVTNEKGIIEINETLPVGKYFIEEVVTTNPLVLNSKPFLVEIKHNQTSYFTQENDLRLVDAEVYKNDIEELNHLNDTYFKVFDISETLKGKDTEEIILIKVNKTLALDDVFGTNNVVYVKDDLHTTNYLNITNNNITTIKTNRISLSVDGKEKDVYIIKDDSSIMNEDFKVISGINVFNGKTGNYYLQIKDRNNFNLFNENVKSIKLYSDISLSEESLIKEYPLNELATLNLTEIKEELPETFYYKEISSVKDKVHILEPEKEEKHYNNDDNLEKIKEVKKEKINYVENGKLLIEDLLHSRKYLVLEHTPTLNHDNISTGYVIDTNYPIDTIKTNLDVSNEKGKGNLKVLKLDEFKDKLPGETTFNIYKANLNPNTNPYHLKFQDLSYEELKGIKGELKGTYTTNNSVLDLKNELVFGYYFLEETSTHQNYEVNNTLYLFEIKHNEETELEFLNKNKDYGIKLDKYDLEEITKKLDGAKYTLYDISDSLDFDNENTLLGSPKEFTNTETTLLNEYYNKNFNNNNTNSYNETILTYAKTNTDLDLKKIAKEVKKDLDLELPVYFKTSNNKDLTITTNSIINVNSTNRVKIQVFGGNLELYSAKKNNKILQNDYFNPYDLEFFKDKDGKEKLNIKSLTYVGTLDTSILGKTKLDYELITVDSTKYNFSLEYEVVENKENKPLYDVNNDVYYVMKDGVKEVVDKNTIKITKKEIVPIIVSNNKDLPKSYVNSLLLEFTVDFVNNDTILKDNDFIVIKGLKVNEAVTGKKYLNYINYLNHNLNVNNVKELTLYHDSDLIIPAAIIKLNNEGRFDLGNLKLNKDRLIATSDQARIINNNFRKEKDVNNINSENAIATNYEFKDIDGKNIKITLFKDIELNKTLYYKDYNIKDKVNSIVLDHQESGTITLENLLYGRKYILVETELPNSYDYIDTTSILIEDGKVYTDRNTKTEDLNITDYNKRRRVDVVVYKSDESKSIKLDGAIFDVNIIEKDTNNKIGLGKYISGGIMQRYLDDNNTPLINAKVLIYTDDTFTNLVKTATTDKDGYIKVLGLPQGKYFLKLERLLKPTFKPKEIIDGKEIINIATENDYIDKNSLPKVFDETRIAYINKGMIYLPEIKHNDKIELIELEAPIGYILDRNSYIIETNSPYGINRIEKFRENKSEKPHFTGVRYE